MKRLALTAFGLALVAALAALAVLVFARTDWLEKYSGATLFLAGVAAVSGVVGVIITWLDGRSSERHLRALAEQQEQAA
jgi:hypothetical protein